MFLLGSVFMYYSSFGRFHLLNVTSEKTQDQN